MRPNVVETVPKVLICEVGPRDGLQSVTATMPTRRVKKSQTSAATVRAPWGSGQGAAAARAGLGCWSRGWQQCLLTGWF